jgi:hypothetical protein
VGYESEVRKCVLTTNVLKIPMCFYVYYVNYVVKPFTFYILDFTFSTQIFSP